MTEDEKISALDVLQEYFPNGGYDFDAVIQLLNAIVDGKIPGIGAVSAEGKGYYSEEKYSSRQSGFEEAAKPLIKWLAESVHPHHTVIVTSTSAELFQGEHVVKTEEFLKD